MFTGGLTASSGGRYPIGLYPESTRRDLSLLVLATAAFFLGAMAFSDRLGFLIAGGYQRPRSRLEYVFGRIQKTKNTRRCCEKLFAHSFRCDGVHTRTFDSVPVTPWV